MDLASHVLWAAAIVGMIGLIVQLSSVMRHLWRHDPAPTWTPGISILKPLCGVDESLEESLELFAQLDYPDYEVVLGVRSVDDPAFAVARRVASRWPRRVRIAVQRGEPGLNPKVNQLITLSQMAQHDILVISDSNVQVPLHYLGTIAAALEDPSVGLVTHPVVGVGEERMGSAMEVMQLSTGVAAGVIAAKRVACKDIVVGKSMALRRSDLRRLGGFETVRDLLAEDYVLGVRISRVLRKRVHLASSPVLQVSSRRGVGEFYRRFERWSVMQRQAVGFGVYLAQGLLNPLLLAALAVAIQPSAAALGGLGALVVVKISVDGLCASRLRGRSPRMVALLSIPLKDLVFGLAWLSGFVRRTIDWRGNRLEVHPGTYLTRVTAGGPNQMLAPQ